MTTSDEGRGTGRGVRRAKIVGVVLVVLGAVWSGVWLWARARAGSEIEAGIALASARGVDIVCGEREIVGYPFRLTVVCRQAGVRTATGALGSVTELRASVAAWAPHLVEITADGPLVAETADGGRIGATWRRLVLRGRATTDGPSAASIAVDDGDVRSTGAGRAETHFAAAHVEGEIRRDGAGGRDVVLAVSSAAGRLTVAGKAVGPKRSDARIVATFGDLWPVGPGNPAAAFAARGGRITPIDLDFSVGGLSIGGHGALVLGRDGILDGTIGLAARGLEGLATASGDLGPEMAGVFGAFILLGRASSDPALPGRRLDLVIEHGRPRFGRLVLAPIPPLFRP